MKTNSVSSTAKGLMDLLRILCVIRTLCLSANCKTGNCQDINKESLHSDKSGDLFQKWQGRRRVESLT